MFVALYLSVGVLACEGKYSSYGAQSAFICISPGFHIGLCPHSTLGFARVSPLQGSLYAFAVSPGVHIGLCPHFTLGFAGVSSFQDSLSYWAFAVLCRGIVFVKCVWVCKWIVAFVRVFCICLIVIVLFVVLIVAFGQ